MREYPYPPRMMTRARAAHYVDVSEAEFERLVSAGQLPGPVQLGSKAHWSRKDLDDWFDRLTGDTGNDWRASSNFYLRKHRAA